MSLWHWAFVCLFLAIVAAVMGFAGFTPTWPRLMRFFFRLFLLAFVALLVLALALHRPLPVVNYGQ